MFFKKRKTVQKTYDPQKQIPVIRCSICTGEETAGFRDKETGRFTEVMLIRSEADLSAFKQEYGVTDLTKEY